MVLVFLAVDNFDFTRKIVKKIWMKNSWKCHNWIFGQKFDFSNSVVWWGENCNKYVESNRNESLFWGWDLDDRRGSWKSWVVNVCHNVSADKMSWLKNFSICVSFWQNWMFGFLTTQKHSSIFDYCLKLIRRIDRGHLDPFRTTEKIIKPDARMDKPLPNYVRGRCTICFCVINEITDYSTFRIFFQTI